MTTSKSVWFSSLLLFKTEMDISYYLYMITWEHNQCLPSIIFHINKYIFIYIDLVTLDIRLQNPHWSHISHLDLLLSGGYNIVNWSYTSTYRHDYKVSCIVILNGCHWLKSSKSLTAFYAKSVTESCDEWSKSISC